MAKELKISISANYANGALKDQQPAETAEITQTNQEYHGPVVTVGTAEEDLSLGDITVNGWVMMKNLDPTNYVTYGPKSAGAMVPYGRLKPNEGWQAVRLEPGVTHRWQANTAACKVQVKAFGN